MAIPIGKQQQLQKQQNTCLAAIRDKDYRELSWMC